VKNAKFVLLLFFALPARQVPGGEPERVDFARDVRPILERSCWKCHGPENQKGGVRLDLRNAAVGVGDSGEPVITPGKADLSELIRRVEAADANQRMPLKSDPLSSAEIRILRAWINRGAVWPETTTAAPSRRQEMVVTADDRQHWSYRPLSQVGLPDLPGATWCRTPIDRFVLAPLRARGVRPNAQADRRTLIRRVYFDLLGLPPSPEEVKTFVANTAPDAYRALVDRLLASPHYGERWGRHWLDVARYADSDGLESDADRPTAYHYRDFVIQAMNGDMSYQTFVRWQIAGDEIEADNSSAVAATGFLAAAPTEVLTVPMEEEKLRFRFNELDDMAVTTISAFLGLTLGCARCHDHKYDAIPTRDYYRLQCAFTTTQREEAPFVSRAEGARCREQRDRWIERIAVARDGLDKWLAKQKTPYAASLRNAKIDALAIGESASILKERPDSEAGKKLARKHAKALAISDDDFRRVFSVQQRQEWDARKEAFEAIKKSEPPRPPTTLAIVDRHATPEPTWLLDRGDFYSKRDLLRLGFLTVLTGAKSPEDYWNLARRQNGRSDSTGQRRGVADWITDIDHGAGALLARVMVNRIWQHHFGEGLVRTVSDFGVRGERPTHPELLEWLARQFVDGGWQLKPLHRLILTSAVYMQDTTYDVDRAAKDAENRLLWRRRPERLEAESLRDAVLSVSGTLDNKPFGPAYKPYIPAEAMLARNTKDPYPKDARDTASTRRRTVYMFHKRVVQYPLMQAFDGPAATVSCGRRGITTVAPQALALLNDSFLRDRSADFARRLLAESAPAPEGWASRGIELALGRSPSHAELTASAHFLETQLARRQARDPSQTMDEHRLRALTDYAQALFSLNEFIYVD
jgi:hypothetical protein